MSELNERRWAVQSEHGREAAGLTYEEAAVLVGRLRGEDTSGLCIITDEAASHLAPAKKAGKQKRRAESGDSKGRRGRKKSA
jgi:hypothetical protein